MHFLMPTGLADGLGLESGLGSHDPFAPAACSAALVPPLPTIGRRLGCNNVELLAPRCVSHQCHASPNRVTNESRTSQGSLTIGLSAARSHAKPSASSLRTIGIVPGTRRPALWRRMFPALENIHNCPSIRWARGTRITASLRRMFVNA